MTEIVEVEQPQIPSSIGKWKTYPTYKDSGIEWLGKIPEHWEIIPVWALFKLGRGRVISNLEIQDNPGQYPVYSSQTEDEGILGYINTYQFDGTYLTWTTDGANAGTVFSRHGKFNCTNVCGTLFPKAHQNDLRFFRYALSCSTFWYVRHDINPKLMNGVMARIRVQVASFSEQHTIATFLDCEISKINTLIAKKERLIELLQEKRAALISHTVTKGLDPGAKMKDSGVEWLGEIPEHWDARQFKHVAEISYGLTLELDRTETVGTPIISLPNVTKQGQLLLDDVPLTPLTSNQEKNLLLRKGDLLFNWRNGSADHVGKTAYFDADGEYTHVSFLLRTRFDPTRFVSRYYQMFLNNLRNTEFFSSAKNRVNKTYNQTELGRLEVMVPPLEEQRMIASYLERETAKIDELIAKIGEAIEKLKEYSTALISAAVTGKIDVREMISSHEE